MVSAVRLSCLRSVFCLLNYISKLSIASRRIKYHLCGDTHVTVHHLHARKVAPFSAPLYSHTSLRAALFRVPSQPIAGQFILTNHRSAYSDQWQNRWTNRSLHKKRLLSGSRVSQRSHQVESMSRKDNCSWPARRKKLRPATMPRRPGTAPRRHQGTLPSDIQPCNGTGTKLHKTRLQSSRQTSPSLIANTTNTTCCTTRLHTIKIVNCWRAVVVIRNATLHYLNIYMWRCLELKNMC